MVRACTLQLAVALALTVVADLAAAAGCKTNKDCSLNGVCTSGACVCDAAWEGDKCQTLALLPAKKVHPTTPPHIILMSANRAKDLVRIHLQLYLRADMSRSTC
jgi:hypothetical protein